MIIDFQQTNSSMGGIIVFPEWTFPPLPLITTVEERPAIGGSEGSTAIRIGGTLTGQTGQ